MKYRVSDIFFPLCLYSLCLFVICGCSNQTGEKLDLCAIKAIDIEADSTCFSDCYDMEIIKLETNKKCLISQVNKLIVNSKGILIYDYASVPQVFSFGHSGKFLSKIGKYGHAKNEYDHVLDVCSNEKGDSIVFLQYGRVKIFDDKGNYLSTSSIDDKYHWEHMERMCNGGFVCASDYTNADDLLNICDYSFHVEQGYVDTKNIEVRHGSYVWNPIWSSHGKIIFCDFYFSSIYVTDIETRQTVCYRIDTGNTAPHGDPRNETKEYDAFLNVAFDGEYVFGDIIHHRYHNMYKFDLKSKTFVIYGCVEDWFPEVKAYHDGCFYAVLTPSFLFALLDRERHFMYEKTYAALREAFAPYAAGLNESDNLYILKMKPKKKG